MKRFQDYDKFVEYNQDELRRLADEKKAESMLDDEGPDAEASQSQFDEVAEDYHSGAFYHIDLFDNWMDIDGIMDEPVISPYGNRFHYMNATYGKYYNLINDAESRDYLDEVFDGGLAYTIENRPRVKYHNKCCEYEYIDTDKCARCEMETEFISLQSL